MTDPQAAASVTETRRSGRTDLDLVHQLVAVPSATGSEAAAVRFMQEVARADGFQVATDREGNFIAETGSGQRLLLFVGHIDTVPGDIPVRVEAGALWGRGSVDAKGPLAAFYCAARRHLDSRDLRIRIVGAVDEEGSSRGAKAIPADLDPSWIVIGEPSGVRGLTLGYKGIVRGAFTLERPRHHGAAPGPTAIEAGIALWQAWTGALQFADRFDAVQGHLTALETASDGLVDRVVGRFNIRLPPGREVDEVESVLRAVTAEHRGRVDVDEHIGPALASKRTDLVAAFLSSMRGQGLEPQLLRKTGTCDFNLLARRHPDVPIVAYGPGDSSLDHTPLEHLELADYERAVDVLDRVLATLASTARSA